MAHHGVGGYDESIRLVAGKLSLDPARIINLPRALQTSIFQRLRLQASADASLHSLLPHQCGKPRFTARCPQTPHCEVWGGGFPFHRDLEELPNWIFCLIECLRFLGQAWHASISHRSPKVWAGRASHTSTLTANNDALGDQKTAQWTRYYNHLPFHLGNAGSSAEAFQVRLVAQQLPRSQRAARSRHT